MRSAAHSADNFHFHVPVSTLEKAGTDKDGNPIMRIGGIASTSATDADNENLHPEGFDLTRLLKGGYFNWQHQTNSNPASIIGHPDVAKIVDGKLYVEGNLYGSSKMAREVFALQKALEAEGNGRNLSFSIEGKATHRDPLNPKRVLKAILTGIAITPTPKNTDSFLSILKGEGSGLAPEYDEEVEGLLLRVQTPDGETATLNKAGEITLLKGEEILALGGQEKKGEKNSEKQLEAAGGVGKFGPYLSKSQVYGELIPFVTGPAQARSLYTVIGAMHPGNMAELTKEDIQKALGNLAELGKLDLTDLTKGALTGALGTEAEAVGMPTGQAGLFDGENALVKSETEVALEAAEQAAAALRAKVELEKSQPITPLTGEAAEVAPGLSKADVSELLEKGFGSYGTALSAQLQPLFEATTNLVKGLSETVERIGGENAQLKEDFARVLAQPKEGKAVLSKSYQGNELGGEAAKEKPTGSKVLNVDNRAHKAELVKAVSQDVGFGTDHFNGDLSREVAKFEATGQLSEGIIAAANKRNIRVVQGAQ